MDVLFAVLLFLLIAVLKDTYGFPYNQLIPRTMGNNDFQEPSLQDIALSQDIIFNNINEKQLPVFINKVSIPEAFRMIASLQRMSMKHRRGRKTIRRSHTKHSQRQARSVFLNALLDDTRFKNEKTYYGIKQPKLRNLFGDFTGDQKRQKRAVVDPITNQGGFGGFGNDRTELERNAEYILRLYRQYQQQQQRENSQSQTPVPYAFEVLFPILHRNID